MACLGFAGCTKDSFVANFGQKPEERMAASIAEVNAVLTSAPNGWVATLSTLDGGGYGFYMNFGANQEVTMYGDLNDNTSSALGKSTFRVKTGLGADLVFDTYNYISMLADPNPSSFGGVRGTGYKSDVEFTYQRTNGDSIIFIGRAYRQPLVLLKATVAEKTIYSTVDGYKTAINKVKNFFETISNPYIEVVSGSSTQKVALSIDVSNSLTAGKRTIFASVSGDGKTISSVTQKYAFNAEGITVVNGGLVWGNITFVSFKWKDAATMAVYDATGKEYIIKSSLVAILPLPNFLDSFGLDTDNKAYYSITVLDASKSTNFQAIWDAIAAEYSIYSTTPVSFIQLVWQATGGDNVLQVRVYTNATSYLRMNFGVSLDANGVTIFRYISSSSSNTVRGRFTKLEKFFTGTYPASTFTSGGTIYNIPADPNPGSQPKFVWSWKDSRYLSNGLGGMFVMDNSGEKTGVSLIGKVGRGTAHTSW